MKTYFEWQTPAGFRPKKSTEALKKALKPALLGAIFSIFVLATIILLWFLLNVKPGSSFAAWYFIFALLAVLALVFPPVSVFVWILFALRRPPRSGRKIKFTENKVVFGESRRGFWKYEDIQSFRIVEEEFRGTTIPVLEMEQFDGDYLSLGITRDVPIDRLTAVLSERIHVAREKVKNSFIVRGRYRQNLVGVLLICFGLITLIAVFSAFFDKRIAEKRAGKVETEVARITNSLESEQLSEAHLQVLEKVIELSVRANLKLAHRTRTLMGVSIASSVVLLGSVLMLWGNNIFLRKKITRLQAYWAELAEGDVTKQEG